MSCTKTGLFAAMPNERFLELLIKQLTADISKDELAELQDLLAAEEANRWQYEIFKDYWKPDEQHYLDSDQMFRKIRSSISLPEKETQIFHIEKKRNKNLYRWTTIAAVLLAGIFVFGFYKLQLSKSNNPAADLQVTATKSSQKSIITLTDGTRVTLNSESRLSYPVNFSGATREVYLSGEGFFDVHKDHKHPFIIHTAKMAVKVLGTAFNVRAYPNDQVSETTLIRGSIEVTLADRPSDRIILKPKEKLIVKNYSSKTPISGKTNLPNIANDSTPGTQYALTSLTYFKKQDTLVVETSWLNNKLVFRNDDFTTIAQKMQRWYGVNIIFENAELKNYRFTGIFEKETIAQAFDALRIIQKFHYKVDKSNVYIY